MVNFNWQCPYCESNATITDSNCTIRISPFYLATKNLQTLETRWIVCPNRECERTALSVYLYPLIPGAIQDSKGELIRSWDLLPSSRALSFPDYIPSAILEDYNEAHSIIELSPKASATLSRRCLQGIIRDFWKIQKHRLIDEIKELKDKIDPLTWESIDAVRKVGNIGAHMEKDINVIVAVDTNEARLLINLVELLLEEWYVHRYQREQKLVAIVSVAESKQAAKLLNGISTE